MKLSGAAWQTPPGGEDGQAMFEASRRSGLEGIIAKRASSPYREGSRGPEWTKVKNHLEQELVIAGWMPGQGRRAGTVGALLVGYYDGDDLVYAGKVGTGFTDRMLDDLERKLAPLRRDSSPFTKGRGVPKQAVFAEPELVGQFEFSEWTRDGQLRAPSFKGYRNDKPARDVVREMPQ
jgi:bifunctional non-homologous end joining protein LigD